MSMKSGMIFSFVLMIAFFILNVILMRMSERGREFKLRQLPVLAMFKDAVGRAVEMGKPIIFVPGNKATFTTIEAPETVAAFACLGYVAKICASLGGRLFVTIGTESGAQITGADVLPYVQDIVETAYTEVGKPEEFRREDIKFYGTQEGPATAALIGQELPGAAFILGPWSSPHIELVAAQRSGAMIIGGTARTAMSVQYLWCFSDYLLIGEEIFAAGAMLSGDRRLLGNIVAADAAKIVLVAIIVVGVVAALAGSNFAVKLFGS